MGDKTFGPSCRFIYKENGGRRERERERERVLMSGNEETTGERVKSRTIDGKALKLQYI